ncbi:YdcF family protein [Limnohabitans lacus]|uniref:YdcF family protein n=1 Tax=Limnohabitans lacus TaxID=3045173 RepID=A0ABT6X3Q7_9BURK|nr:YdcF family protein [Limnohabitans sp. HM2-2]MDI9232740.1 YdcF family protein [Limnohabitans sp. HM2-2]
MYVSGGDGRLLATGVPDADLAKVFYQEQGVDMSRVTLDGGSRTTRENARQVAALLGPRCQEPWLLVTSAWHMPRAMARDGGNCRNGQLRPWLQSKLICAQHSSGGLGEAVWRLKKMKRIHVGAFHRDEVLCSLSTNDAVA